MKIGIIAGAAFAGAAASLPVAQTAAVAEPIPVELGYFDEAGLHLPWGEAFQRSQRDTGRRADESRRAYDRCRNPSSGASLDILRFGLGAALGHRVGPRILLRPAPRQPSGDCGNAPTAVSGAASVNLVDANDAASGRAAVVAKIIFHNADDNLVRNSAALGGKCLALMDGASHLIPVRSMSDPDPYGFANPAASDPRRGLESRADNLRQRIAARQQAAVSARETLASQSNYKFGIGECTTPPGAPIPPRPASMSEAEIEDQAAGSCVDLMMRRHDPAKVMGALRSVRQEALLSSMRRYQAHPAACASDMPSQANDVMIRAVCAYSDIACYGTIQTVINECRVLVRRSCGAPLAAWERRVETINAAPAAARAQCEGARQNFIGARDDIASLQAELENVEGELGRLRATAPTPRAVPLSQARCGG